MPKDDVLTIEVKKPIQVWRPSETQMVSLFLRDGKIHGELSEGTRTIAIAADAVRGIPSLVALRTANTLRNFLSDTYVSLGECSDGSYTLTVNGRLRGGWGYEIHGGRKHTFWLTRWMFPRQRVEGTYNWAKKVFDNCDISAKRIAHNCNGVDWQLGYDPLFCPSRHFNVNAHGEIDSRIEKAVEHFVSAVQTGTHAYDYSYKMAFWQCELGIGLHSIQDIFAHDIAYVSSLVGVLHHINPWGTPADDPFHVRPGYFDSHDVNEGETYDHPTIRYYDTQAASYIYLTMFRLVTAENAEKAVEYITLLNGLLKNVVVFYDKVIVGFLDAFILALRSKGIDLPIKYSKELKTSPTIEYGTPRRVSNTGVLVFGLDETKSYFPLVPHKNFTEEKSERYTKYANFFNLCALIDIDTVPAELFIMSDGPIAATSEELNEWLDTCSSVVTQKKLLTLGLDMVLYENPDREVRVEANKLKFIHCEPQWFIKYRKSSGEEINGDIASLFPKNSVNLIILLSEYRDNPSDRIKVGILKIVDPGTEYLLDTISVNLSVKRDVKIALQLKIPLDFISIVLTALLDKRVFYANTARRFVYNACLSGLVKTAKEFQIKDLDGKCLAEAHQFIGLDYRERFRFNRAKKEFQRVLETIDHNVRTQGELLKQTELLKLQRAALFAKGSISFLSHRDYAEAREDIDRANSLNRVLGDSGSSVALEIYRHLGCANMRCDDYATAGGIFKKILLITERQARTHEFFLLRCECSINLAHIKYHLMHYREAADSLREVIEKLENDPELKTHNKMYFARRLRGKALQADKNFTEAEGLFKTNIDEINLDTTPSLLKDYISCCCRLAIMLQPRSRDMAEFYAEKLCQALAQHALVEPQDLFAKKVQKLFDHGLVLDSVRKSLVGSIERSFCDEQDLSPPRKLPRCASRFFSSADTNSEDRPISDRERTLYQI